MSGPWTQQLTELTGLPATPLGDLDGLAAVSLAAAGAMGVAALTPPVVRRGAGTHAVVLLGVDAHIVLHASPDAGTCLVDLVSRLPGAVDRGLEVIARRLRGPAAG